jgi:hypothetical protein
MPLFNSISTANTSETALQLVEKTGDEVHERSPLSHLAIAFLVVFLPLLAIPIFLCAFITYWGVDLASASESCHELHGNENDNGSYYYTVIALQYVVSTSSWSSNVAQFATAPFLFLFSFMVASRFIPHREPNSDTTSIRATDTYNETRPVRKLLAGRPDSVRQWLQDFLLNRNKARGPTVRFTALGSILALALRYGDPPECELQFLSLTLEKFVHDLRR